MLHFQAKHLFEENGGLALLEPLEYHNNPEIQTQVAGFLEVYFYQDEEDTWARGQGTGRIPCDCYMWLLLWQPDLFAGIGNHNLAIFLEVKMFLRHASGQGMCAVLNPNSVALNLH